MSARATNGRARPRLRRGQRVWRGGWHCGAAGPVLAVEPVVVRRVPRGPEVELEYLARRPGLISTSDLARECGIPYLVPRRLLFHSRCDADNYRGEPGIG